MPWTAQLLSEQILDGIREGSYSFDIHKRLPEALADDLAAAGIRRDAVLTDASVRIGEGYSISPRPWDAVIMEDDLPVAAVEVKISIGQAGKALRNRLDDLVAMATNMARTFDGPERRPYRPCVALVFIMEKSVETTTPFVARRTASPFAGHTSREPKSYLDLAGEKFSQMLSDGLFDAVCYLTVDREEMKVFEPVAEQSFDAFVTRLIACIADSAQRRASEGLSAAGLGRILARGENVEEVVAGLTSTPEGLSAAEAAVIRERRRVVADLQQLALDPGTNETKMHAAIGNRYWVFGGQYVGIADRRTMVPLDQYDIPLICADGSLEIVELKGPEAKLVRKHRNHLIVSDEVHEAVNQCLNYLRHLDELGAALRTHYINELQMDVDFRRAKGTVVIGHPGRHLSAGFSREQIDQTIRSYNAHLSRLTVLTYADVLESADRTLRFASEESARDHNAASTP